MNPQPDRDSERRQKKLDAQLNQTYVPPPAVPQQQLPQKPLATGFESVQSPLNRFINWFNGLSSFGKLIVIGVAATVSLAILRAVLTLVVSVISLALLGVILYFLYQLLPAHKKTETKE